MRKHRGRFETVGSGREGVALPSGAIAKTARGANVAAMAGSRPYSLSKLKIPTFKERGRHNQCFSTLPAP